jgi:exonuclease III
MTIKFLSLNIRGLGDKAKRSNLFGLLKRDPVFSTFDLVLLQETKLHNSDHKYFQQQWNSQAFFSSVGGHSGTLILIRKKSNITILSHWSDTEGRVVQVKLMWNDLELTVSSVYAPATHAERIQFFNNLADILPHADTDLHVIGGDFNCVLAPGLDRSGGTPNSGNVGSLELQSIMTELDLEDAWRTRNPDTKEFTFTGHYTNGIVRSRLDRWLSSELLRPFIKNIEHISVPFPNLDHKAVAITLADPDKIKLGDGYWMLNTALLENLGYTSEMKKVISLHISLKPLYPNPMLWWDALKQACKEFTITFASALAKSQVAYENTLLDKLKLTEGYLNESPGSAPLQKTLKFIQDQLDSFATKKLEGAIIRSRSTFLAAQEIPSKKLKMITTLKEKALEIQKLNHPQLGLSSDPKTMLETASLFYGNLYGPPPASAEVYEAQDKLLSFWPKSATLSHDDLSSGEPITKDEALSALKSTSGGKSPGIDGLPSTFFLHFWDLVGPHFTQMLNDVKDLGLSPTQRRAVVTLLYKSGDPTDIANYRPISVLCHDYKVLAKVFVQRLHKYTDILISKDQTGVKGRYIGENLRQFIDCFNYLHLTKHPAIILLLDQAKAFDRVSWSLLHKILKHAGFPFAFRQWIHQLYACPTSSIKINNHLSDPFDLLGGVRQGCPLSPILFCLIMECLNKALLADKHIKGVPLPGNPAPGRCLSSLYMDDTTLYLRDADDFNRVKPICQLYCLASNSLFNWTKSEGITFNMKTPPPDPLFPITWLKKGQAFKTLGAKLTNSFPIDLSVPWNNVITKFADTLKMGAWQFSLRGRVTFVKTYAMSKLYYLANALPTSPLQTLQLQKMIWKYIWRNSNRGSVRRDVLLLPHHLGGLDVPSVAISLQAIHLKWISRLLALHPFYDRPWAAFAAYFISNLTSDWGLGLFPILFKPISPTYNYIPCFWKSALEGWWQLIDKVDLSQLSKEEILSFPLFNNPYIKSPKGPLSGKKWLAWARVGICRVRDIWDNGFWASRSRLQEVFDFQIKPADLLTLHNAIPGHWTDTLTQRWDHSEGLWGLDLNISFQILKPSLITQTQQFALEYVGPLPLPSNALSSGPLLEITNLEYLRPLRLNGSQIAFSDLQPIIPDRVSVNKTHFSKFSSKQSRHNLTPICVPPAMISWNALCMSLNWKKIFQQLWKPVVPRTWNQTYFLLIHRGLPHGDRAYRHDSAYPPNWDCPQCQKPETLQHIFFECDIAQHLLNWISRTWKNGTGSAPPLDLFFILSGYPTTMNRQKFRKELLMILALIHRAFLQAIWRTRCDSHHGGLLSKPQALALLQKNISTTLMSWSTLPRQKHLFAVAKTLLPPLLVIPPA